MFCGKLTKAFNIFPRIRLFDAARNTGGAAEAANVILTKIAEKS